MDRDSDVHSALDTIADFCTQSEEQSENPFDVSYYGDGATETEVKLIKAALNKWTRLNNFRSRLWDIFRKTVKNGDQFFLRDPETGEWLWIDHFSVEMVKVDDTTGKEPDEYIIRGLDYNKVAKFATGAADPLQYRTPLGTSNVGGSRPVGTGNSSTFSLAGSHADNRRMGTLGTQDQLYVVDAQHVIHLSLSNGMDINWPFGESVLESIFKVFKQKELLEDAIIIYRVQRAPERRIFYIDTGSMPANRAKAYLETVKQEIHQRRIPNRTGGGACIDLETKIPLFDGRTLSLNDMITEYSDGKQNWVYSVDPETGKIVPGKVTWAGITRRNSKVIKITLDNGKVITCTKDHQIPVWNKGYVEASKLTTDDSLFAFNAIEKDRKLVSIEEVENSMDVGTITVDGNEEFHAYHTFAIEQGIFIKNSVLDAAYSPLSTLDDYFFAMGSEGRGSKVETLPGGECFTLDTMIPLLDGRTLPLSDIIKEHQEGKLLWAYSVDPKTGKTVPGMIDWAGITRKDAKVMRITLDNGKSVICTPDHRFPLQNGIEKEARNLTLDDSFFPFEFRKEKIRPQKKSKTYNQIFDNSSKQWTFVHRLVAEYFRDTKIYKEMEHDPKYRHIKKGTVHHLDFNRYNNSPDNLSWMSYLDHRDYHSSHLQQFGDLAKAGIIKYWAEMPLEERIARAEFSRRRNQEAFDRKTPEEKEEFFRIERTRNFNKMLEDRSISWKELLKERVNGKPLAKSNRKQGKKRVCSSFITDIRMMQCVADVAKQLDIATMNTVMNRLDHDAKFQSLLKELNPTFDYRCIYKMSKEKLNTILNNHGFDNWRQFKQNNFIFNHRIVKIEYLDEPMDVGTITIDGLEVYHNFHNFALDAGIYTKNCVGEIGDLVHFRNQMFEGLRIPPMYSFRNVDNGGMALNDGKLGTALVQEFLFNKYCIRLQSLLAKTFDYEFKFYLRKTGIEIDENIFELKFCAPQNFAKYRQIELDTQQIQVFTQISENKIIANRTKLKKYLGWTDDEILENEKAWKEENPDRIKKKTNTESAPENQAGLSSVGVRSGAMFPDTGFDTAPTETFTPEDGGGETPPSEGGAPAPTPSVSNAPPPEG